MDMLVTSMVVFCDAPLDFAYGGAAAGTGAKLAAEAWTGGGVSSRLAEEEAAARHVSTGPAWRQAECAPALDGLNCFETVVMPSH